MLLRLALAPGTPRTAEAAATLANRGRDQDSLPGRSPAFSGRGPDEALRDLERALRRRRHRAERGHAHLSRPRAVCTLVEREVRLCDQW